MKAPDWALAELGWTAERYHRLRTIPDPDAARADLEELQATATSIYRRRARELHPDRPENGPAETEKLIALNAAIEVIRKIELAERPRPPIQPRVQWYTATASSLGTHSFWRASGTFYVRT